MRILRYYPRAVVGDGGMTGAVRRWSEAFVRAGASATIAYEDTGDPALDRPSEEGGVRWLPVRHVRMGRSTIPLDFDEVLQDADVVVLHSGWALQNIWVGALARKRGVPYILEPRGAYDPHIVARKKLLKKAWWLAAEKELVMGAAAIHAFFEQERAHLDALGYRGPVVVASNGVEAPPAQVWDGGSGGYVLWLGRFDPEHKGLDTLLAALRRIAPDERPVVRIHGPDWRNQKRRVRELIAAMGLESWACVGDSVHGPAKREMLARAQGFVYPSRWDACPNSVLESVACGVPTLATPYPLGVTLAGRGGAILADGTPASLADGLRALVGASAAEIGARGGRLLRDEYSWDHVAGSWLGQVEAVL